MQNCPIERARNLIGNRLAQRRSKGGCRLPDQIGFGDTRKKRRKRGDAALLRQTAGNPVDAIIARQRRRRRIRVGCLGIVDEHYLATPPDRLHAMLQPGEMM